MTRRRAGFTLVELLVVIAIIGVLVALLLPAVQSAREAGRRTTCINHLKQISLAFHHHHDAYNTLPSAGGPDWTYHMTINNGAPAIAGKQHGGWGYQILPFVEAQSVWTGGTATTDIDRSIFAISTPHSFLFCPSRRKPEVLKAGDWLTKLPDETPGSSGKTFGHAKNDYAAASHDSDSQHPTGIGAVTQMKPQRFNDILDGTATVMLISEKRMNIRLLGQMQASDNEGYACGWNHDIMRYTERAPKPDFTHPSDYGTDDLFGSSHPGGMVYANTDGSVHFLRYNVSLTTFQRMGRRDDGQAFAPH